MVGQSHTYGAPVVKVSAACSQTSPLHRWAASSDRGGEESVTILEHRHRQYQRAEHPAVSRPERSSRRCFSTSAAASRTRLEPPVEITRYPAELVDYLCRHSRRKVLFGSNHPAWTPVVCLAGFDTLDLEPTVAQRFLRDNAAEVFGLDPV